MRTLNPGERIPVGLTINVTGKARITRKGKPRRLEIVLEEIDGGMSPAIAVGHALKRVERPDVANVDLVRVKLSADTDEFLAHPSQVLVPEGDVCSVIAIRNGEPARWDCTLLGASESPEGPVFRTALRTK